MRARILSIAAAVLLVFTAGYAAAETFTYEITGWSLTHTVNAETFTPPVAGWTATPGIDPVYNSMIVIEDDGVSPPVLVTWQNHNVLDTDFVSCATTGACPSPGPAPPQGFPPGSTYVTAAHVIIDTWVVAPGPVVMPGPISHIPASGPGSLDFGTLTGVTTNGPPGSTDQGIFCEAGCAWEATLSGATFVVPGTFDLTCAAEPNMRTVVNGGFAPSGCDPAAGLIETPDGDTPIYAPGPGIAASTQTFGPIAFTDGPDTMSTSPCPFANTGPLESEGNQDCVYTFTSPPVGDPNPHQQWGRYTPPAALTEDPGTPGNVDAACLYQTGSGEVNEGNWWCTANGRATILSGTQDPFSRDPGGLLGTRVGFQVPLLAPFLGIGVLASSIGLLGLRRLRKDEEA